MTEPKRVVITGASSGIGAAAAIAFARGGARLVLAARGVEGLEDTARRVREAGGQATVHAADVTDADAVKALAAFAKDTLGGIDLWFSDVGIGTVGKYGDVPMAEHARVVEVNLVGHMNDAHAVLPIFLGQGHGTWVNMISAGGLVATPWAAAYAASKFGLRGFSQALRGEVSKLPRIHICDVYPLFVDTPGIDHAGNHTGGKLGLPPGALSPETVAKAVVRLADKPRNTTVVGAPAFALVGAQALVPNLLSAFTNGFFETYFRRAEPASDTPGAAFEPPAGASGVDGGRRDLPARRTGAAVAGGVALAVLAGGTLLLRRRRA